MERSREKCSSLTCRASHKIDAIQLSVRGHRSQGCVYCSVAHMRSRTVRKAIDLPPLLSRWVPTQYTTENRPNGTRHRKLPGVLFLDDVLGPAGLSKMQSRTHFLDCAFDRSREVPSRYDAAPSQLLPRPCSPLRGMLSFASRPSMLARAFAVFSLAAPAWPRRCPQQKIR